LLKTAFGKKVFFLVIPHSMGRFSKIEKNGGCHFGGKTGFPLQQSEFP